MKINLLITGGLGYVGSFTAKNILNRNKKKTYVIDNLSRGNVFAKKYSNYEILNVSDKKVQKFIQNKKINTILHLAALTCVRESINNRDKYYKNFKSQLRFIELLKKTKSNKKNHKIYSIFPNDVYVQNKSSKFKRK